MRELVTQMVDEYLYEDDINGINRRILDKAVLIGNDEISARDRMIAEILQEVSKHQEINTNVIRNNILVLYDIFKKVTGHKITEYEFMLLDKIYGDNKQGDD